MPAQKRHKTKYPGVYYIEGKAVGSNKIEKIYYIAYRKDGKQIHEKAGRQGKDDMTPARAAGIRAERIAGKQPTNKERRRKEREAKKAEKAKWTIDRIFDSYIKARPDNKARAVDQGRYDKYLKEPFGAMEPKEIVPLDVDRVRLRLLKKLSPQTVTHVLSLLTWILNYGVDKQLCDRLSFRIKKPPVNNLKTEDLNPEQMNALFREIETYHNPQIRGLMKTALFTGLRRGELFKLKWEDVDFDRGFIRIVGPKGGANQVIPMNNAARGVLESHPRTESPYVFPGRGGKQRVSVQVDVNRIKKRAGLPKDFRPLHGLRHAYASMLASSGQVDMYTLQKLLTHKSAAMTARYAHLRDETLKRATNVADGLFDGIVKAAGVDERKVSNGDGKK
jgi:integrase